MQNHDDLSSFEATSQNEARPFSDFEQEIEEKPMQQKTNQPKRRGPYKKVIKDLKKKDLKKNSKKQRNGDEDNDPENDDDNSGEENGNNINDGKDKKENPETLYLYRLLKSIRVYTCTKIEEKIDHQILKDYFKCAREIWSAHKDQQEYEFDEYHWSLTTEQTKSFNSKDVKTQSDLSEADLLKKLLVFADNVERIRQQEDEGFDQGQIEQIEWIKQLIKEVELSQYAEMTKKGDTNAIMSQFAPNNTTEKQVNEARFRIRGKAIFITLSMVFFDVYVSKEFFTNHCIACLGGEETVKWSICVVEKHKSNEATYNTSHLHLLIHMNTQCSISNARLFDFRLETKLPPVKEYNAEIGDLLSKVDYQPNQRAIYNFHPNLGGVKSLKAAVVYLHKEDQVPHYHGITKQEAYIIGKMSQTKYTLSQVACGKNVIDEISNNPCLMRSYSQIVKFQQDKEKQIAKKFLKKSQPGDGKNTIVHVSGEPGVGKTQLLITVLKGVYGDEYEDKVHIVAQNKAYFDGLKSSHEILVYPDLTTATMGICEKHFLVQGNCESQSYDVKFNDVITRIKLVYIVGQDYPEDLFKTTNRLAIQRRTTYLEITRKEEVVGKDQIDYPFYQLNIRTFTRRLHSTFTDDETKEKSYLDDETQIETDSEIKDRCINSIGFLMHKQLWAMYESENPLSKLKNVRYFLNKEYLNMIHISRNVKTLNAFREIQLRNKSKKEIIDRLEVNITMEELQFNSFKLPKHLVKQVDYTDNFEKVEKELSEEEKLLQEEYLLDEVLKVKKKKEKREEELETSSTKSKKIKLDDQIETKLEDSQQFVHFDNLVDQEAELQDLKKKKIVEIFDSEEEFEKIQRQIDSQDKLTQDLQSLEHIDNEKDVATDILIDTMKKIFSPNDLEDPEELFNESREELKSNKNDWDTSSYNKSADFQFDCTEKLTEFHEEEEKTNL